MLNAHLHPHLPISLLGEQQDGCLVTKERPLKRRLLVPLSQPHPTLGWNSLRAWGWWGLYTEVKLVHPCRLRGQAASSPPRPWLTGCIRVMFVHESFLAFLLEWSSGASLGGADASPFSLSLAQPMMFTFRVPGHLDLLSRQMGLGGGGWLVAEFGSGSKAGSL